MGEFIVKEENSLRDLENISCQRLKGLSKPKIDLHRSDFGQKTEYWVLDPS